MFARQNGAHLKIEEVIAISQEISVRRQCIPPELIGTAELMAGAPITTALLLNLPKSQESGPRPEGSPTSSATGGLSTTV